MPIDTLDLTRSVFFPSQSVKIITKMKTNSIVAVVISIIAIASSAVPSRRQLPVDASILAKFPQLPSRPVVKNAHYVGFEEVEGMVYQTQTIAFGILYFTYNQLEAALQPYAEGTDVISHAQLVIDEATNTALDIFVNFKMNPEGPMGELALLITDTISKYEAIYSDYIPKLTKVISADAPAALQDVEKVNQIFEQDIADTLKPLLELIKQYLPSQ